MIDLIRIAAAVAYGYLVGSVPTAYLVGRWKKGIDIRQYGSGNVGASNVARHVGKADYVAVALFDVFLKGAGAVLVARWLGLDLGYQGLAALAAVAGHNWSLYLRFTGGRGLSVTVGALLFLAWKEWVALVVVGLLGWAVFKSLGLWSMIALALLPIWALVFREPMPIFLFCVALLAVTVLKRLMSNPGTAPAGLRWRDMAIPRLLYDRDTPKAGNWVARQPKDTRQEDGR